MCVIKWKSKWICGKNHFSSIERWAKNTCELEEVAGWTDKYNCGLEILLNIHTDRSRHVRISFQQVADSPSLLPDLLRLYAPPSPKSPYAYKYRRLLFFQTGPKLDPLAVVQHLEEAIHMKLEWGRGGYPKFLYNTCGRGYIFQKNVFDTYIHTRAGKNKTQVAKWVSWKKNF